MPCHITGRKIEGEIWTSEIFLAIGCDFVAPESLLNIGCGKSHLIVKIKLNFSEIFWFPGRQSGATSRIRKSFRCDFWMRLVAPDSHAHQKTKFVVVWNEVFHVPFYLILSRLSFLAKCGMKFEDYILNSHIAKFCCELTRLCLDFE